MEGSEETTVTMETFQANEYTGVKGEVKEKVEKAKDVGIMAER
jgi:hypothetical protein